MKIEVRAVHVHHGIREGGADADEAYVREICRKWEVDLTVFHEDVPEYARRHKLTLEEAGRDVRRQCLEKAADAWGGQRLPWRIIRMTMWRLCFLILAEGAA